MRQTGYTITTDKAFLVKVYLNDKPWIDHKAYEESQEYIERMIASKKTKFRNARRKEVKEELKKQIELLKRIEVSLQLALETY